MAKRRQSAALFSARARRLDSGHRPGRAPQRLRRLASEWLEDRRMLHGLTTGAGDGSLDIAVDGYGSFGAAVGGIESGEAVYDPVGSIPAASTTFESGVAIRIGSSGPRQFLTGGSIGSSGGLAEPAITGNTTSATSDFTYGGLTFHLLQTVASMVNDQNVRTGSLLGQSYTITNNGNAAIDFEMVRYIDGDLLFDGSLVDGGGRITLSGSEFLFETDAGGTGSTDTTFVGIDTFGGTAPSSSRFEVAAYPTLEERIIAGTALDNTIDGDNNNDGFVDAGAEYDVTLALRNVFHIEPGASVVYATRTVFGSGTPGAVNIGIPTVDAGPDVSKLEGDSGTVDFVFPVTLSEAPLSPVTVAYATRDVTASSPGDYTPVSGTLTFLPSGGLTQYVTVQVQGDQLAEANETFHLKLSDIVGGIEGRLESIGTILNDDVELSVEDLTITEGDNGTKNAVFTVDAIGAVNSTVQASYHTTDATAVAGKDYQPRSGVLTFPAGTTSRTVTVPIVGDVLSELTETFTLDLVGALNAKIVKSPGVATIIDNDPLPVFYVNDVQITSSGASNTSAVFTVALDRPSGTTVAVDYITSDGAALAGVDYTAQTGTLVFPAGVTTLQVTVPVVTPSSYVANKSFYLNLFNPSVALVGDSQAAATFVYSTPSTHNYIMDDGDPGYSRSAGWTNLTNTLAYQLDYDYHTAGNGSGTATWNFTNVTPGTYQVFAKWIPFSNRATNAPYTIFDGSTQLGTVLVNQQLFPAGDQSNGIIWQSLGMFSTSTGTLSVRLGDNANGYVIADAIRLVKDGVTSQIPEMDVSAFGRSVDTGDATPALDDGTDFGTLASLSNSATHTFRIANNGNADLHLTGTPRVDVIGANASDFTVVAQPNATVGPGYGTTFDVMFHPTGIGLRTAVISIANDDDSEHPYTFTVQGTGDAAGPNQFVVDDSSPGFSKQGAWATNTNTLAYQSQLLSDAAGSGSDWARWTFSSLAPGQYDVYATWVAFGNRATNAPFTVADGTRSQFTTLANQQAWPGTTINGFNWTSLGSLSSTTGTITVTLNNSANGYVMADAVMIVRHDYAAQQNVSAHNAAMPLDVNGDGHVSSFDALLVIGSLLSGSEPQASPLAAAATSAPSYYRDVNGDGVISPRDALLVISYLLNPPAAAPSAAPLAAPSAATAVVDYAAVDSAISQLAVSSSAASDAAAELSAVVVPADVVVPTVAPAAAQAVLELRGQDEDAEDDWLLDLGA